MKDNSQVFIRRCIGLLFMEKEYYRAWYFEKIVFVLFVLLLSTFELSVALGDEARELSGGGKSQPSAQSNFVVYDGTKYRNKPDLASHGIRPIRVLYNNQFWNKGESTDNLPSKRRVEDIAQDLAEAGEWVVIDIEVWPVQGYNRRPWIMEQNIEKYMTVFRWIKDVDPSLTVGYFGRVPITSNYKGSIMDPASAEYAKWQSDNDRMKPLAALVDVAFPSAYTYSDDRVQWKKSLLAKIRETRRIFDGHIFVFLWPQYFDHAPAPKQIRLQYMPADFWRFQLETAKQYADGIVIWGGWDFGEWRPQQWDDEAPWWQVTKTFMDSLKQ